jgi:hypothetical protein
VASKTALRASSTTARVPLPFGAAETRATKEPLPGVTAGALLETPSRSMAVGRQFRLMARRRAQNEDDPRVADMDGVQGRGSRASGQQQRQNDLHPERVAYFLKTAPLKVIAAPQ